MCVCVCNAFTGSQPQAGRLCMRWCTGSHFRAKLWILWGLGREFAPRKGCKGASNSGGLMKFTLLLEFQSIVLDKPYTPLVKISCVLQCAPFIPFWLSPALQPSLCLPPSAYARLSCRLMQPANRATPCIPLLPTSRSALTLTSAPSTCTPAMPQDWNNATILEGDTYAYARQATSATG